MKLKWLVQRVLGIGVYRASGLLLREMRLAVVHRRSVRCVRAISRHEPVKLNAGCGKNVRPGWLNIDAFNEGATRLDLRESLPLVDGCAEEIYSEHFFEHIRYPDDTGRFLAESLRVLRPGGIFSVGVPDTEPVLRAYPDDRAYFAKARETWHHGLTTPLHQVNYHFRQGGEHLYAYDFLTLKELLEGAGFVDVRRRDFDPVRDSEVRREGTLYVDATRP